MRLVWLVLGSLLVAIPAEATTYWVSKTGSDSNTCVQAQTQATAKLTVSAGITCMVAAHTDILIIKAGTYTDLLSVFDGGVTLPSGTSYANAATIKANAGDTVILQSTSGWPLLHIATVSYLIVEDLILDGTNLFGNANPVSITASSDHTRLTRVTGRNGPVTGFAISGTFLECTDCIAYNNGTHGSLDHGFYFSGANNSADNTCLRCIAYNNSGYGYHQASGSNGPGPTRSVCDSCILHDNVTGGALMGDGRIGAQRGNVIKNSIAYNNGSFGFRFADTQGGESLLNDTAYGNGNGIAVTGDTINANVKNSLSVGNTGPNYTDTSLGGTTQVTNLFTGVATALFVNPTTNDFHLKTGSAAIDAGTDIGVPFFGSAPDQGAYEYGAKLWFGILDSNRASEWAYAGAGAIPARAIQCGSIIAPYSGTTGTINTALSNCPAGQHVQLSTGLFNLTGVVSIPNDVTLRGSGPTSAGTVLNVDGAGGCDPGENGTVAVCMGTSAGAYYFAANQATLSGDFSKGSNTLTATMVSGAAPVVGTILTINQLNDTVDTGALYVFSNTSDAICPGSVTASYSTRCYTQMARVTNRTGSGPYVLTFYPPLQGNYWTASQSPRAVWVTSQRKNAGLENLQIIFDFSTISFVTAITACDSCWIKNVTQVEVYGGTPRCCGGRAQVTTGGSIFTSIVDSYFYGTRSANTKSYGIEEGPSGFSLLQNNIFEHIVTPILAGNATGSVWAYNYAIDDYCDSSGTIVACGPTTQMPGPVWGHDAGHFLNLTEGNDGHGFTTDALHGNGASLNTLFRNRLGLLDPGKSTNTHVIYLTKYARHDNIIGNVLGQPGWPTVYSALLGAGGECDKTIYTIGYTSFPCGTGFGGTSAEATIVWNSTMRWGNYDVITGAPRWNASEVPVGAVFYPNTVPASQVLPPSFYLPAQPSWWTTPWGTPQWPPIGPDVTGGNISLGSGVEATLDGHAYKIPARLCYENTSVTGGIKNFDASVCYLSGSVSTIPLPPTGVSVQ